MSNVHPSPDQPDSQLTNVESAIPATPTVDWSKQLTTETACLSFLNEQGYQDVKSIHGGSEGWVFRAADRLHDSVAIKIPKFGKENYQNKINRLIREARILKRFNEVPQIVNAWFCGPPQSPCYSLLRWIEGGKIAVGQERNVAASARIIADIAGALVRVHQDQVIHRDIKPDNILLDKEGRGWLTDFGISQVGTEAGPGLGTYGYFPFEQYAQAQSGRVVEPSVDIFALGVVFYQLLTGQHPFPTNSWSAYLTALKDRQPLTWPSGRFDRLPSFCERMLAQDPAERPTAAEVYERLKKYLPVPASDPKAGRKSGSKFFLLLEELPGTVPAFVGRTDLLQELDRFASRNSAVKVVCICGQTGQGKTALVNQWLRRLPEQQPSWLGFERLLIWTFKKQRNRQNVSLSAMTSSEFSDRAFEALGESKTKRHEDLVARGQRLANVLDQRRTLVVLDGIELFQSHVADPMLGLECGQCTDQFVAGFLEGLVHAKNVFCLTTAQLPLAELSSWRGAGFEERMLAPLSADEGAELLQQYGCLDDRETLRKLSQRFHHRPADLVLLAKYVNNVHGGHARLAERELGGLSRGIITSSADDQTARDVWQNLFSSYQAWQQRMGQGPEAALLKAACLFNRPAPLDWLRRLFAKDVIPGLTDDLINLDERELHRRLNRLEQFGLLEPTRPNLSQRVIDVPPLVRTFFDGRFSREQPSVRQAAHRRLFDILADEEFVKDLPEATTVDILITAIWHGCQAGAVQDAWKLHQTRLNRHEYDSAGRLVSHQYYLRNTLGAPELELASLLNFCTRPWMPLPDLSEDDQSDIMLSAAILLRAQGEMNAAAAQFQQALDRFTKLEDHRRALNASRHLSQLFLAIGKMDEALKYAESGRAIADDHPSLKSFERIEALATLGDVLHQLGEIDAARTVFEEAEQLQSSHKEWPRLIRLAGARYGQFLLAQGQAREVLQRFDDPDLAAIHAPFVLAQGLTRVLVCQAKLALARDASPPNSPELKECALNLLADYDEGLRLLDESNQFQFLADGFLSRAEARRLAGRWDDAWDDLDKARHFIDHKGFTRMLADWHLENAELCLARSQCDPNGAKSLLEDARREFQAAQQRIREMPRYHRRDAALKQLADRL